MPKQQFLRDFRAAVSNERLDMYRQRGVSGGDENLLIHYAWNIVLAESLYPTLQCLEVALRNSVHDAASNAYETPYWFDTPDLLDPRFAEGIAQAKTDLENKGKSITPAGIIAEQSFGFWSSLFNRSQEQVLWPKIHKKAFPNIPQHLRKRGTISSRLRDIRTLRNRIMHHEPIWYIRDLGDTHQNILQMVKWISPAMAEFVETIDRFPELYSSGMSAFQSDFEKRFSRISPER